MCVSFHNVTAFAPTESDLVPTTTNGGFAREQYIFLHATCRAYEPPINMNYRSCSKYKVSCSIRIYICMYLPGPK